MDKFNLLKFDQETGKVVQEIFSIGKWNGKEFTLDDLKAMVSAFNALKDNLKIPLKLGHNDEQTLTDGEPALGWVTDIRLNNDTQKLEAVFDITSPVVMQAMYKQMYRTVSVEMYEDVQYKGKDFKFVITAVALLGADLPAVNNLNDLTKYFSNSLNFANTGDDCGFVKDRKFTFNLNHEVKNMDELKELKQQFAELQSKFSTVEASNKELEEKNKTLVAEKEANEAKQKAEKFKADKEKLEADCEQLVKDETILPAKRESLIKDLDETNFESRRMAVDLLLDTNEKQSVDDKEKGFNKEHKEVNDYKSADDLLAQKASEIAATQKCDYSTAVIRAMQANQDAAQQYVDYDLQH